MNEKTLEALKGSIAKWESIVAGTDADRCSSNCPLCQRFKDGCDGCPVAEKTQQAGCAGSPWDLWDECVSGSGSRRADTPERVKLAQDELDFLRSLLPAETM